MSEYSSTSYKKSRTSTSDYDSKQKTGDIKPTNSGNGNPHPAGSKTGASAHGKSPSYETMSNFDGIPANMPVRTTGDQLPGGIKPTNTESDKMAKASQGWLNYLKTGEKPDAAPSDKPAGGIPKTANDWLNFLNHGVDGLKKIFGSVKGQVSKFLGRLTTNPGDQRPTDMTATSGITNKVGYADPRGMTCYSKEFLKALNSSKSLHEALGKLDGKNVCEGLNQRPQHVEPDKVGDTDYRKSNATVSKSNKDPNVKQFIGGFAGNDGGNINFDRTVKRVTDAIGRLANDPTKVIKSNPKAGDYKAFFDQVADYLKKNPDKKAVVTTYTATHGNVYSNGNKRKDGKEGGGNGSTLGIDEKTYDKYVRALKKQFGSRVFVNDIWDCCHAGAFMPARKTV